MPATAHEHAKGALLACLQREHGSAIAEVLFEGSLIALLCAAIFLLAFALHVGNTLVDSVGEGARYAALHGSSLEATVARTRVLVDAALPSTYSKNVSAFRTQVAGVSAVEIGARAPLPLIGFLGPTVVTSTGRAVVE